MPYLVIADFIWAISAWVVDVYKLPQIPPWAWIFVVVCPIYPILLALVFLKFLGKKKVNPYLLAFAAIPSAVFGILTLAYYPAKMVFQGFNGNDFGQIFWVLFYSVQGWWLVKNERLALIPILAVTAFLTTAFVIDYKFKTFGYLNFTLFPNSYITFLFILAVAVTYLLLAFHLIRKEN